MRFTLNLALPGSALVLRGNKSIPPIIVYVLLILSSLFFCTYMIIKRAYYNRKFLKRTYLASNTLFGVMAIIEIPLTGIFYYFCWHPWVAICHGVLSGFTFLYVMLSRSKRRMRVASFSSPLRLGIMSRDVGNEHLTGLQAGEVVKIMRKTASGYVVKNSRQDEFEIAEGDISEVIEMV